MQEIILMSGGIDSLIAWYYLGKPTAYYVPLLTHYTEKELLTFERLSRIDKEIKDSLIIEADFPLGKFEIGDKANIPGRNLFLALLGAQYAKNVYIIGINGDDVPDKNIRAFMKMSEVISEITGEKISIRSPFWAYSKSEIIKWFLETDKVKLSLPDRIKLLKTSVSCYSEDEGQCGECPSCFRKWIALEYNHINTRDIFLKNPATTKTAQEYWKRVLDKKFNSKKRYEETRTVLQRYFGKCNEERPSRLGKIGCSIRIRVREE